jgi:N-acetylmuramoyl-L-alanine amidase
VTVTKGGGYMGNHVVEQGEHIALIAERAGFRSAKTIWDAPENAALRKKRDNPHVLMPGDVVFVPDKQQKTESRATGKRHVFKAIGDKLKLRVVLLDFDNRPLPDVPAVLEVEGTRYEVTSDGTGLIEKDVPRSARSGRLEVAEFGIDLALHIGHLDPVAEESGWRARLINLGYYRGTITDEGETADKLFAWALEEFQCDMKLPVTGKPDGATLAKLLTVHGS